MAEPNLTTPRLFWVRAVYDFISTVSTDVSFREGDILAVTSVSPTYGRHWWLASNILGETGCVPSNYVQVLPQFSAPSLSGDAVIKDMKVTQHESSSQALLLTFTSSTSGTSGASDTSPPAQEPTSLVKTIPQLAQFTRELSRMFPEAGLPLDLEPDSDWSALLQALHAFNHNRTASTASTYLLLILSFPSLIPLLYTWLCPTVPSPRLQSKSIVALSPNKMGVEAIVLYEWQGDKDNGELQNLAVGDHIILVHEQNDWAYCRKSPESAECGYVPLMYLRKLSDAVDQHGENKPPPLPSHIKEQKSQSGEGGDGKNESMMNEGEEEKVEKAVENVTKPFNLKTTRAFDELVNDGWTVEITERGEPNGVGDPVVIGDGISVSLKCEAMKWEASAGVVRTFATTEEDPNAARLTFVAGKGHVVDCLDEGVRQLVVGDSAVIVGSPNFGFGDSGLAGIVNSKAYLVYQVTVLSAARYDGEAGEEDDVCYGPDAMLFRKNRCNTRVMSVASPVVRPQMPAPNSTGSSSANEVDTAGRDSMSTNDLLAQAARSSLIMGMGAEGCDDEGRSSIVCMESGEEVGIAEVEGEAGDVAGAKEATTPPPMPVTPPPPPPPTGFRLKQAAAPAAGHSGRPNAVNTTPPPPSGKEGLPLSPSDQIMSPVSQALRGGKGLGGAPGIPGVQGVRRSSGSGLLRNMMIKKSSGALSGLAEGVGGDGPPPMPKSMPPPIPIPKSKEEVEVSEEEEEKEEEEGVSDYGMMMPSL